MDDINFAWNGPHRHSAQFTFALWAEDIIRTVEKACLKASAEKSFLFVTIMVTFFPGP